MPPIRASRTTSPVATPRTDVHLLFASLVGAGTSNPTFPTQEALNGEILSATRTNTGKWDVTFRYTYPELKQAPVFSFVGTTDGLIGQCSAIDINAGTASFEFYVGSTPTDLATTDTVFISWAARFSGRNK